MHWGNPWPPGHHKQERPYKDVLTISLDLALVVALLQDRWQTGETASAAPRTTWAVTIPALGNRAEIVEVSLRTLQDPSSPTGCSSMVPFIPALQGSKFSPTNLLL